MTAVTFTPPGCRTALRLAAVVLATTAVGVAESRWTGAPAVQATVGHTDNALLSSLAPQASWFGETKVDSLWQRGTAERWQASAYLEATWRHYFAPTLEVRDQGGWHLQSEVRWMPASWIAVGVSAGGFGETSVVDFSETTDTRLIAVARLRGGSLGTRIRFDLYRTLTLQATARTSRVDYRTFSGDHSVREPGARLEWRPLARLTVSAGWRATTRDYADRPRYTAGGRALAGTRLAIDHVTSDFAVQWALDARGATTIGLQGGRGDARDGGSGYFDYRLTRGSLRFEHRHGHWRWLAEFGRRDQVYRVQTGGTGIAPPPREARRTLLELQVERRLGARWTWQGAFTRETERGNLAEFDFAAATATSGLRFTF